jgi:outer membrane immunogenic protein
MKRLVLALAGVAALTGSAAAADLGQPAPAPYYKAPVYAPVYNWSGFYIGVNGTVGYNYQMNQVVLGVEGDIDWADINGNKTTTGVCALGCTTKDSWLSTVRGRLGYAADRFMPYVTGGLALGDIQASLPGFAGGNTTNAGWTIGGGIEFAIAGHWTAKAEYLYVDLGNFNCGIACGAATQNVSFTANLFRGGINYRF